MPRENALFRPYLERLDEKFPDKEILSQTECANFFFGYVNLWVR